MAANVTTATKKPCFKFQGGHCPFGDTCRYSHERAKPSGKTKLCRHFEKGQCPYGVKCMFSHDTPPQPKCDAKEVPKAPTSYEDLVRWRYNIPRDENEIRRARKLGGSLAMFIEQALSLVDACAETMQQVVTALASEGGLHRLRELLDEDFSAMDDELLSTTYKDQLLPLLRILSHKKVLASQVAEGRHATLLAYVYGTSGTRATSVFRASVRGLGLQSDLTIELEPCLIALSCVFEANSSAQVHQDLRAVADTMIAFVVDHSLSGDVLRHYNKMRLRLGLAANISSTGKGSKNTASLLKPVFNIPIDQPGEESPLGPRHDNDCADIRDVQILPTLQEIESTRPEYLPRDEPSTWHIRGVEGLLDKHFRLVREDTVGQLRDAARFELQRLRNPQDHQTSKPQGARIFSYSNADLVHAEFDQRKGLKCVLAFDQPRELRNKNEKQRAQWWTESKRLGPEALVALMGPEALAIFVTVATATIPPRPDHDAELEAKIPLEDRFSLSRDKDVAHVIVQTVNHTSSDVEALMSRYGQRLAHSAQRGSFSIIEFPGVLLPAFEHTLKALQQMRNAYDMPFRDILAPLPGMRPADGIAIPAYARRQGFRFDVSAITLANDELHIIPNAPLDASELSEMTTLDLAQAQGVISALTQSLALVQGPPGTGKSFTGVAMMKVLLANKSTAKLGPIVCVTFTNHALDQALENLVGAGVSQIVRIGSQSKSELLANLNLRQVARKYEHTKIEKRGKWETMTAMEGASTAINAILDRIRLAKSDAGILTHLKDTSPNYYLQLCEDRIDEDGFVDAEKKKRVGRLSDWLRGGDRQPASRVRRQPQNVFELTNHERQQLHAFWVDESTSKLLRELHFQLRTYDDEKRRSDNIRAEVDLRVLSDANVIGVTTSGLARNINLLRKLESKVLLVEEAGEVLEAHLLTAMLPSLEHVILIGDHQQLRPKVQNYNLSCDNPSSQTQLDISLFERLVRPAQDPTGGIPYVTLEMQRRMHGSISNLIRTTLYPNLTDGPNVAEYPEVSGMRNRLFWLHHAHREDTKEGANATSRTNQHEVDMVFALVKHLVRQDAYRASDIAVLTPYLGQLRKLRQALSSFTDIVQDERDLDEPAREDLSRQPSTQTKAPAAWPHAAVAKTTLLEAVRLATVDNFQGEEAKVVVISLVRSNEEQKCGFLKTSNRINVLLSRAQHGMYIIGNTKTSRGVPMWNSVVEILEHNGNHGNALELCCQRHPEAPLSVKSPDDFLRLAPEAGCDLMCGKQLLCGHSCVNKCHPEGMHNAVYCLKQCTRPKAGCDHNCEYECGRKCDVRCKQLVPGDELDIPCGHSVGKVPCWQFQNPDTIRCKAIVDKIVLGCKHKVSVECCVDVNDPDYDCTAPCNTVLDCGHVCKQQCHNCRRTHRGEVIEEDHGKCQQRCGREFTTCKHSCAVKCHGGDPCPLCMEACDVKCSHAQCAKKCHEPCAPCAEETCASKCPHAECTMPCAAPCDWTPCSKRCDQFLTCGHQCPSVCGADCPTANFCQICASDDIKNIRADVIMMSSYGEVDLSDTPCMFLPCGHIFTVDTLDGLMGMRDHYNIDPLTGMPTSLSSNSEPFSADQLKSKVCPDCRASLNHISRYGRIVRRVLLDESTKKFIAWSNRVYLQLAESLKTEQDNLKRKQEINRFSTIGVTLGYDMQCLLTKLKQLQNIGPRYRPLGKVLIKVRKFSGQVAKEEQPFSRVHGMVETARRRRLEQNKRTQAVPFDETVLQTRGHLLATALAIRCELVAIADFVHIWSQNGRGAVRAQFALNREQCANLAKGAEASHNILQQTEGHIFWARFAAFERVLMEPGAANEAAASLQSIQQAADTHLDKAKALCEEYEGQTAGVKHELEDVRRLLHEAGHKSEMKMIVAAMRSEFSGTGHWYRCENGHPFTVGECGAPMQTARCPQCNAPIGGAHHQAANGVQHAGDIEEQFGGMHL